MVTNALYTDAAVEPTENVPSDLVAAYVDDFAHSVFGYFDDSQFDQERYVQRRT
jgi:hypothetical protein